MATISFNIFLFDVNFDKSTYKDQKFCCPSPLRVTVGSFKLGPNQ